VARALSQLRLVGVNGPYSVLLGAGEYTALAETRDHGYPVLEHLKRIVDGNIAWAPAIESGLVLTTRGGDFELNLGQNVSIGYLSHTDSLVRLYLQETFTFRVLSEAGIALSPSQKSGEEGFQQRVFEDPHRIRVFLQRAGKSSQVRITLPPQHLSSLLSIT
jgi:hypothetical protein